MGVNREWARVSTAPPNRCRISTRTRHHAVALSGPPPHSRRRRRCRRQWRGSRVRRRARAQKLETPNARGGRYHGILFSTRAIAGSSLGRTTNYGTNRKERAGEKRKRRPPAEAGLVKRETRRNFERQGGGGGGKAKRGVRGAQLVLHKAEKCRRTTWVYVCGPFPSCCLSPCLFFARGGTARGPKRARTKKYCENKKILRGGAALRCFLLCDARVYLCMYMCTFARRGDVPVYVPVWGAFGSPKRLDNKRQESGRCCCCCCWLGCFLCACEGLVAQVRV